MHKTTLLEILDAAHLTKHINSPFPQRGGIMLVGPPSSLKTTFIKSVFEEHYDALVVSDLNIQTLIKLRDDLKQGRYSSIAFTEFEKIYHRRADTAENLQTSIQMLVEEGFHRASFEDQRMAQSKARCFVAGAITTNCYERRYDEWDKAGFLRRFLWCVINLANADLLMDAIANWEPLDLGSYKAKNPGNKFIPYDVTDLENSTLRRWIKEQPGQTTPFVLMKKILCVLKWKYKKESQSKAMDLLADFAPSLSRDGDDIQLGLDELPRGRARAERAKA